MTTVLIIDDDANYQRIVSKVISNTFSGAALTSATTLAEAKNLLTQTFDLIVIDQHLPDGLGTDFIASGIFGKTAVLSLSSDAAPTLPAEAIISGAHYFISKSEISSPTFVPLVKAIVERNQTMQKLAQLELLQERERTVKTLLDTLSHEINNPLGAVMGISFLFRKNMGDEERDETALLLAASANRIRTALHELRNAAQLEIVEKGGSDLFNLPGDGKWKK